MKKKFYSPDYVLELHLKEAGILMGYIQRNDSPIQQELSGIYIHQEATIKLAFFVDANFGEQLNRLSAFSGEISKGENKEVVNVTFIKVDENFSKIDTSVHGVLSFSTEIKDALYQRHQANSVMPKNA